MQTKEIQRIWKGLDFLSGFITSNQKKFTVTEAKLQSLKYSEKKYRVQIYSPSKSAFPGYAILLIHGMSGFGIDDPRIHNLASSLCKSGYTIFVPELEEVKALLITEDTVQNISDIVLSLQKQKEDWKFTKLGFFSISFTGGLGLISLAGISPDLIRSVLVVGPFADFSKTLPFVLENFDKDNYAGFVFLYNFIEVVVKKSPELKRILYEAALDNGLKRTGENAKAEKLKADLSNENLRIYENILTSYEYRIHLYEKFRKECSFLIESLSPINYIERISAPITLIHGSDDLVISESESIELAKILEEKGKTYLLEITGMLSHGDALPFYKQIPHVLGFARAFGYFFENLTV